METSPKWSWSRANFEKTAKSAAVGYAVPHNVHDSDELNSASSCSSTACQALRTMEQSKTALGSSDDRKYLRQAAVSLDRLSARRSSMLMQNAHVGM
jgi:hypothetical protein